MTAGPAPTPWWRSAARHLLAGPEPAESLLGSAVALLGPVGRRMGRIAGAVGLALSVVVLWEELDRAAAFYRLGPVVVLALARALPAALAPRRPLLAWRLSLLATVVTAAAAPLADPGALPWPAVVGGAHLLVLVQLAAAVPRAVAVAAALVDGIALAALLAGAARLALGLLAVPLILTALVTALGISAGGLRAASGRLVEQRRWIAEEQERRAVVEERARITRELHDVVAHHLSLIAVRAETAPCRRLGLDEQARDELAEVATTARSALVEMRRLLGVLRSEHASPERTPQPQLADLPDLVASARRSGLPARLTVHGTPQGEAPAAVGVTAYRLVQEALSNAGRHAAGAPVTVDVDHLPTAVRVR